MRSGVSPLESRAREISSFLKKPLSEVLIRLYKGFAYQHECIRLDFKLANPQTDEELLQWYRKTEEYIWELTAYHSDPGFNYSGMVKGIVERLATFDTIRRVLCLGDGIGDLTLALHRAGFKAVYHDLANSRTAAFARFRFERHGVAEEIRLSMNTGWEPHLRSQAYDAVISLDFLEHVTDVEGWVHAIYEAIRPGGVLVAQNAFNIGSGPEGSIPCHLARNDRYEKDWDPLLESLHFIQLSSNWYRRP